MHIEFHIIKENEFNSCFCNGPKAILFILFFCTFLISGFSQCVAPVHLGISQVKVCNEAPLQLWRRFWGDEERITSDRSDMGTMGHLVTSHSHSTHSWN